MNKKMMMLIASLFLAIIGIVLLLHGNTLNHSLEGELIKKFGTKDDLLPGTLWMVFGGILLAAGVIIAVVGNSNLFIPANKHLIMSNKATSIGAFMNKKQIMLILSLFLAIIGIVLLLHGNTLNHSLEGELIKEYGKSDLLPGTLWMVFGSILLTAGVIVAVGHLKMSNKITNYAQDTYNELVHKVSWPSWADLKSSAIVVMVASLIIALVIFAMDFSFQKLFQVLYKIL